MRDISNEWDNASKEWINSLEFNQHRANVLIPQTFMMLGDVKGKRVLDLGCGEGGYSRLLAGKGASIVGIDYSEELINEAIRQNTKNDIEYYVKDACFLDGIEDGYFDIVISAMCLMAIKDLESAVKEAFRVLTSGGIFIISMLHPCFQQIDYFNEGAFQDPLSEYFGKPITFWHRTLSNTINCMIEAGFNLEFLYEPAFSKQNDKMPKCLLLKLKK